MAIDIDAWLAGGATPWDAFPNTGKGKIDAETGPLAAALASPNVTLLTGATVVRLETDASGKAIDAVHVQLHGETTRITPKLVVLAAGAINSAALLLRSANMAMPKGLANSSDQVGRNFMNHNSTAMLAMNLGTPNRSVYQKTLGLNDFYLKDPATGYPLGNAQLLGKVSGAILKANLRFVPETLLAMAAYRSFDWYLQSEDLAHPESRVRIDGNDVVLQWVRSNLQAHGLLVERMRNVLREAGFPIILTKPFDKHATSHQCGTVRIGTDPETAPLDAFCRSYDHSNLFVVDGSFLPSSAAVNPALTIAAQALRVAHHIAGEKPVGQPR